MGCIWISLADFNAAMRVRSSAVILVSSVSNCTSSAVTLSCTSRTSSDGGARRGLLDRRLRLPEACTQSLRRRTKDRVPLVRERHRGQDKIVTVSDSPAGPQALHGSAKKVCFPSTLTPAYFCRRSFSLGCFRVLNRHHVDRLVGYGRPD
jgi:hypothetical protein